LGKLVNKLNKNNYFQELEDDDVSKDTELSSLMVIRVDILLMDFRSRSVVEVAFQDCALLIGYGRCDTTNLKLGYLGGCDFECPPGPDSGQNP
jgi:hypothetical protein